MTRLQDAPGAVAYAAAVLGSVFVLATSVVGFTRATTLPDFSAMFDPSEPAVAPRHDGRQHLPVAAVNGGAIRG